MDGRDGRHDVGRNVDDVQLLAAAQHLVKDAEDAHEQRVEVGHTQGLEARVLQPVVAEVEIAVVAMRFADAPIDFGDQLVLKLLEHHRKVGVQSRCAPAAAP